MEFEKLKTSNNKYDRIFYETIEDVFTRNDLEIDKGIFYKTYLNKKQKKHDRQYKEIEGFKGPFRGKYLKGYSPQFRGKNFDTLKEVLEAFKKDDFAQGITMTRNGKYTIRRSTELLESRINDNGSMEISWILENKKKIDIKEGGRFEKIKIKGIEYFFNLDTYKIYNESGKKVGILSKGIFTHALSGFRPF